MVQAGMSEATPFLPKLILYSFKNYFYQRKPFKLTLEMLMLRS